MREEEIRSAVEQLSGKDEASLMGELRDLTQSQRQTGELNDSKLDEIYAMLAPALTQAQKKKMEQVIARLKG